MAGRLSFALSVFRRIFTKKPVRSEVNRLSGCPVPTIVGSLGPHRNEQFPVSSDRNIGFQLAYSDSSFKIEIRKSYATLLVSPQSVALFLRI